MVSTKFAEKTKNVKGLNNAEIWVVRNEHFWGPKSGLRTGLFCAPGIQKEPAPVVRFGASLGDPNQAYGQGSFLLFQIPKDPVR